MLSRDKHASLFIESINYVANLVETEKHILCIYFVFAPFVGEIDSRLEMLARDEHSSLFIESVN
jgi:hypothetical protein